MINLLPSMPMVAGHIVGNRQFIAMDSLDRVLLEAQLTNAKHPEGKVEYDEVLQALRDAFAKIQWSKPE